MAYVSYKDKNKSGHYDWNILIALLLFLVAIIAFVVYKVFIVSDADTKPLTSQPSVQEQVDVQAKQALPVKKLAPQPASKTEPQTKTVAPTNTKANNSESIASQRKTSASEVKEEQLLSEPAQVKPAQKPSLKCSDEDQKAGLCN